VRPEGPGDEDREDRGRYGCRDLREEQQSAVSSPFSKPRRSRARTPLCEDARFSHRVRAVMEVGNLLVASRGRTLGDCCAGHGLEELGGSDPVLLPRAVTARGWPTDSWGRLPQIIRSSD
jgi:hypothetical protein